MLRYNLNRRADRVRVFEVGRVFLHDPAIKAGELQVEGFAQPKMFGALAYGPALGRAVGRSRRAPSISSTSRAIVEALLAPVVAAFRESRASGAASGTQRAD